MQFNALYSIYNSILIGGLHTEEVGNLHGDGVHHLALVGLLPDTPSAGGIE